MTLPTHLLWIDLETTGLDPLRDDILEVAAYRARFSEPFDIANEPGLSQVVSHRDWSRVSQEVIDMHSAFGLIEACVRSTTTLAEIEESIMQMLVPIDAEKGSLLIAGSTVHFDKAFIARHMRRLATFLSHCTYDVSSVRNFAYSLGMPEMPPRNPAPHRANDDVLASIELGRTLQTWFDMYDRHGLLRGAST